MTHNSQMGKALMGLAMKLPKDNPKRLFYEWLDRNKHRIPEACTDLGVELPSDGAALFMRLQDVVTPALVKRGDNRKVFAMEE